MNEDTSAFAGHMGRYRGVCLLRTLDDDGLERLERNPGYGISIDFDPDVGGFVLGGSATSCELQPVTSRHAVVVATEHDPSPRDGRPRRVCVLGGHLAVAEDGRVTCSLGVEIEWPDRIARGVMVFEGEPDARSVPAPTVRVLH